MSVLDHSKTTAKRDELILRIVSALVLAPLTIGVTLLGGNVFDGFWFIAAVLMSGIVSAQARGGAAFGSGGSKGYWPCNEYRTVSCGVKSRSFLN
jgi:hypothetical protein